MIHYLVLIDPQAHHNSHLLTVHNWLKHRVVGIYSACGISLHSVFVCVCVHASVWVCMCVGVCMHVDVGVKREGRVTLGTCSAGRLINLHSAHNTLSHYIILWYECNA